MKRLLLFIFLLSFSFAGFAQVSGGSFTPSSCVAGDVNWTNPGTVNTILIFAKAGSAITVGTPTSNESTYTANPAFGSGTAYQNDAAAFCIYKSTSSGTTVGITALTPGVTYHFLAYNVNGTTYSASHAFSGSTPALANATALTATPGDGSMVLNWANPSCFDQVMMVAKPTSTIGGTPTGDGTAYTADPNFGGAGTVFDGTGKVVYENNGTTETVTGLTNGTTYFFRVFTRKGTTWSAGIEVSATPYAPATAGAFNTDICLTTGTATWTNPGTVGTIVVFAKATSAVTVGVPTNNISTYTADPNFGGAGTAYQHDGSAKCVYKGTGNSVSITGLTAGVTYHFLVFNANGTSYSASHAFSGPTLNTPPNATGLTTTPAATSINFSWTNPICFDEMMVVAKTTTIAGTPTGDGTAYTADPNFGGAGTVFDGSGKVVFKGTGTSVNVTGLATSTTYFLRVFTRKGTTWSAGAETSATTICTPVNVTALKISDANTTANLYWTDPACFDQVMIVAKQGTASTPATITLAPTGDGTAYTADPIFTGGGTAFDGGKVVFKSNTNPGAGGFQTTNLTTGLIYTFKVFTRKGTVWSAGVVITTVPGPPVLIASTLNPGDETSGVPTDQIFTATFNEKIYISHTTAAGNDDDVEFDPATGTSQLIARGAGGPTIGITGKDLSLAPSGGLTELNIVYNILIGNKVLTDSTGNVSGAGGGVNDFVGTAAGTWNFTTSPGVTITAPTVGTCVSQYTTLGNIVITETGNNNFQGTNGGSFTFVLGFDKTGYIFSPGTAGVTATPLGGGDIQSVTVTSVTFTQATFTVNFFAATATDNHDEITISGLKVSRDGSMAPPALIQVAASSTLPVQGINEQGTPPVTTLGTINGGTVPGAPTITYPAGDNTYCVNATFTGITITASDPDVPAETFNWYNDAALTVVNAIGDIDRTVAELIGGSPAAGTYTRYATQVDGCESIAATVTIIITSLPVASAGPNLTGGSAVCSGTTVALGGSPTATGGTGSYTYAWAGPGSPASVSNPNHVMPDPGGSDQTYNFQVTVTDGNSCVSVPSTKMVTVKNISENVSFTQPSTFFYSVNSNPVDLVGSPAGGTFSGVGVIQLSGSYQFDPELAGINSPAGWPVTYTTTLANGCTKSIVQNFEVVAAFDVFAALGNEYCNNEPFVQLEVSPTTIADMDAYIANWNTNYTVAPYFYSPLKTAYTGIIRNEYETYYGDNNSVTQVAGTYVSGGKTLNRHRFFPTAWVTDQAYPVGGGTNGTCATCYYGFVSVFLEFASPAATAPYNMPVGFDQGWRFNNGTVAGFSWNGEFVNLNPVPVVNFSGLLPNYCNLNIDYDITGNKPGGIYEISDDNIAFGDVVGDGIKDATEGIAAGLAEFNPQDAYGAASGALVQYIRYSVDPGTTGSTGQSCVGRQTQSTTIFPSDQIFFRTAAPAVPPNNTEFCYEGASFPVTVGLTAGGVALTTGVTFSGFGMADNGSGVGTFTPKTAFDQQAPGSPVAQNIIITATYTNSQGCQFSINRTFIVRPTITNNVSVTPPPPDNNFCYNDASVTLLGNTSTSTVYDIEYISLGYTQTINSTTFDFDPSVYYDDAVAHGGSNVSDATFNIKYTVTDAIGCTASSTRLFAVSPLAVITISGINDGDRFCSNVQPFDITFAPINGSLEIDDIPVPVNPISPSINFVSLPIGDAVKVEYTYLSGVSQCPTNKFYTISKIDAPVASFSASPVCDGDPATFAAGFDPDNFSWKWVLGDSVREGTGNENINHIFPGLSQGATATSYLIRLIVTNGPSALKVCRDSTEAIQVIGAYPKVDFDYADVCQNDFTRFMISSNIPIVSSEWDFDDGAQLPNTTLTVPIPPGTHSGNTQGTYGQPEHRFAFTAGVENRYDVELIARTDPGVGACADIVTRQVAILEKLHPTPPAPYIMGAVGPGGSGLWIEEDRSDSSTWIFAAPTAKLAMTNTVGNVWITNATGVYLAKDNSFVNSPCFDLSDFTKPVIGLRYWCNSDFGKDGAVLQYSTNGGASWQVLGNTTSGTNWYSNATISSAPGGFNQYGWTSRLQQDWLTGKNSLDVVAGNSNVRFRIAFASDEREEFDGFAFNNVVIEERNRIMLVEHFSNADTDADIVESNTEYNTDVVLNDVDEVVKIQYHTSFPDADPINANNPADHNARAAYYGVTSQTMPLGFIDGNRDLNAPFGFTAPPNPPWWNDFKQKRSLNSSPYTLTVTSMPSGSTEELTIRVTGNRLATVPGNKPVLHVGVIEKDESGNQHVMRKLVPNASGTPLDPSAATIDLTFVWRAEGLTDLPDLAIIAFIQDEITKEIHQSAIDLNPTNLPSGVITGVEDPAYAEKINLFPNPANHELTIELPMTATKSTPVTLVDTYGRVVYDNTIRPGERTKTVRTTELPGGIYFVQISTPEGNTARRKVMIVHR